MASALQAEARESGGLGICHRQQLPGGFTAVIWWPSGDSQSSEPTLRGPFLGNEAWAGD